MSYAQQAAKGPKQSPEDRAPIPPQAEKRTSAPGVDLTVDEAANKAGDTYETGKQKASEAASDAKGKAEEATGQSKSKASEFSKEAQKDFEKAKSVTRKEGKKIGDGLKGEYDEIYENRDNPVVIANAVAIVAGTAALAYTGYQKYSVGELDWKIVGLTGAVVGALGVGDYFLSQWLFENKYPKK